MSSRARHKRGSSAHAVKSCMSHVSNPRGSGIDQAVILLRAAIPRESRDG